VRTRWFLERPAFGTARRGEGDVPLRLDVDGLRQKIERNTASSGIARAGLA
jgi:hypothetical protein